MSCCMYASTYYRVYSCKESILTVVKACVTSHTQYPRNHERALLSFSTPSINSAVGPINSLAD